MAGDTSPEVTAVLARVASSLPGGGEERPGQREMAEAVARAVAGRRHLVVQAGTGTGKSLAYLVPAALSRRRVVVATATKALQDQLATKDLPLLSEVLGDRFTYAVLKGRSNYLCRQRAEEVAGGGDQPTLASAPLLGADDPERAPDDTADSGELAAPTRLVDQVRHLVAWAEETHTGDRADLPFEPDPRAWAMVSVGPRECPGAFNCPSGGRCFAEAARGAAAAADVVVVNTHLYGSHLASGGAVLPDHDVVVFDEAHQLEEVMTASLGAELSPGRFRALGAMARPLLDAPGDGEVVDGLSTMADRLQTVLTPRVGQRVLAGASPADHELPEALAVASNRVQAVLSRLRRPPPADTLLPMGDEQVDTTGRRARALSAATHLAEDLGRLGAVGDHEVAWVDGTPRAPVLRLSPVDVGPPLAAQLWPDVTAVLTSATIPPRMADRVGLTAAAEDGGRPVDQLDVGSPFDYRSHALLYVARHLPDRRDPRAEPALHEELEALITAAGGRTLALFTSRRATQEAVAALTDRLPYRVLVQDELPKPKLLAAFAEDETSCLFATIGLWQGVDVVGPALSLVTLDRLPFARPDDPLMEARRELAGDAAFRLVDLPRAATLLAQGAGRLIRSAEDRGVVAVLDPRLATAGYRGVLLAGLPPMRRTTDRRQVEDFLRRALDDRGEA